MKLQNSLSQNHRSCDLDIITTDLDQQVKPHRIERHVYIYMYTYLVLQQLCEKPVNQYAKIELQLTTVFIID